MKQNPKIVLSRKHSGSMLKAMDAQTLEQVVSRIRSQQWSIQAARDVIAWMIEENNESV